MGDPGSGRLEPPGQTEDGTLTGPGGTPPDRPQDGTWQAPADDQGVTQS